MTGYQSKKAAAQDKLEQWDMPSEAFNAWWDSDYDDSANPYEKDTFAYWAWAGWQAALAQPVQEPEYWNVIDPSGNVVASETDAIRGWARIAGSYKPTVEGLLGLHEQGWRVLPKVAPPLPVQPAPVQDSTCNETLHAQGKAYPRICKKCRLGPCVGKPKAVNTPPAAQPAQEPVCPECKAEVLYECVACSSNNYPPQGAQKPVAWMFQSGDKFGWRDEIQFVQPPNHPVFRNVVALFTAPLQRTWVGSGDLEDSNAYQTPPAQPAQERNFCPRCGKRTQYIHTCTPPQEST
jgi:hypothetical protein